MQLLFPGTVGLKRHDDQGKRQVEIEATFVRGNNSFDTTACNVWWTPDCQVME